MAHERLEGINRDEVIHEIRKRIKKARALIHLTSGSIRRKLIVKADRRLRDAARPLSAVRDAAALLQTLEDLADRAGDEVPAEVVAEIRATLEAHRDEVTRERDGEGGPFAHLAKAIRSTRRRLANWDDSSDRDLDYRRAYREARDVSRAATDDPSPARLHEFRKRVKALEFQLATVEADPAGRVARIQRLAGLLADELGQVHDLDVLREFVERADGSSPLLGPIDRRLVGLRHDALRRAGVVFLDKPRVFEKMIKGESRAESVPSEL